MLPRKICWQCLIIEPRWFLLTPRVSLPVLNDECAQTGAGAGFYRAMYGRSRMTIDCRISKLPWLENVGNPPTR